MIGNTMLAATGASSNNPAALSALALILLSLAEPINPPTQNELYELIDKWGRTLQGIDPVVVDSLTAQLRAIRAPIDALAGSLKQAS